MIELHEIPELRSRASLNGFVRSRFGGSLNDFITELNALSDRLIRTNLRKSAQLTGRTRHLHRFLPPEQAAHLYRISGRHHHLSGNYGEAYKLYQKARAMFSRCGDAFFRAKIGKALLDVLMYLNRYEDALELGRETLRYFKRRKAEIDFAQVASNIGNVYHRLDQNKKAHRYYLTALEVFEKTDNTYAQAVVKFNLGNALTNLNSLDEAEDLYRAAAELYRDMKMDLAAAQADYSLAYVAFLKGEYSASLRMFESTAEEFRRLGDRKCQALSKLDLTEVSLHLNLYSQAITDARAVADDFRRLRLDYEQAKALYLSAVGNFAFGDYSTVAQRLREAQRLFRKEKNTVWQLACRLLRARMDMQEHRYARADKTLCEIASTYKRLGELRRWYDVRLLLFEAASLAGRSRSAAARQSALVRDLNRLTGYQRFVHHMISGEFRSRQGMAEKAKDAYQRAIECVRKMRTAIFPDELQRYFWMDKLAAFTRLAGLLLKDGDYDSAYAVLEEGKAGLSVSGAYSRGSQTAVPAEYKQERRRLRSLLRRAMMPVGSSARSAISTSEIRSAEHTLWRLERSIRTQPAARANDTGYSDIGLRSVQHRLQTGEAVISYGGRPDLFGAFVVTRDDISFVDFPGGYDNLRGLLARFYFSIGADTSHLSQEDLLDNMLSGISERIWEPAAAKIEGASRIFVVPDGIFNRVPFSALKARDGRYLYETGRVRIHAHAAHIGKDSGSQSAPKSLTTIAATGPDLPYGTREAQLVASRFSGSKLHIGAEATSDRLFAALRIQGGIVHLVSHAAQSYENDMFSPILLNDGPVYPFDLFAREAKSALVVLSACQTGDTGIFYRGQTDSLAHAFLAAGAQAAVASHWPISDEATAVYMDYMYTFLKDGNSPDRAIAGAMEQMRAKSTDIRHWAAFYLMHR